jgi:hypothetical protein
MSSTDRQNRLLLAEDWQKIYQSFKYADFKSYDFDNLRRTMINYIRQNYPEDFNDYIESSEYLSLIDLIAFLGQNISFRVDLNARENFIELAERRESVLRLARLISYNVTRNQTANGLLKIDSVTTTENIVDTTGTNISGKSVKWNDQTNSNWYEQFIKIMNAAMLDQNQFGSPRKSDIVNGIPTEKYKLNNLQSAFPVFSFNKVINGTNLDFEVVGADIDNGEIIEEAPLTGNKFSLLYRDNGQGAGSSNTGFFLHFRQGTLQRGDFSVSLPTPNQNVEIDATNVNNSDVWLYSLNSQGVEETAWTKVDAVEGNNVIYNSIAKNIKNIFSVLTRTNDRISLIFSDGVFGNLPKGNFRAYYRTSANLDYTIFANNIQNIKVSIPYTSGIGRNETLSIVCSLKQPVTNGASTESTDSIRDNAPSTYYTQNRLITGEDYNLGPLGVSQDIIKAKAVNRTSSGINRYYDLRDSTGKYSTTNMFGTDGVIYKDYKTEKTNFSFVTKTDIEGVINNTVTNLLEDNNLRNYYYDKFTDQDYSDLSVVWQQTTKDTNRSTGFIVDSSNASDTSAFKYTVSSFTEGVFRYLEPGALVKFTAPTGQHFMPDGTLMLGAADHAGSSSYKWVKVVAVNNGGNELSASGLGGITFNDIIPTGAILNKIKPKFVRDLIDDVKSVLVDQIFAYRTVALRYNTSTRRWAVVTQENVNTTQEWSSGLTGDITQQNLDRSWLVLFETNGVEYTITSRTLRYVFESDKEVRFFYDSTKKIYDSKTGEIVRDKISILNINKNLASTGQLTPFTVDYDWAVSAEYRDGIGYVNSKKVEVVFFDNDDDGVVDNPQIFEDITANNNSSQSKYVFVKKSTNDNEFYYYVDAAAENIRVVTSEVEATVTTPGDPIFYVSSTNVFYKVNSTARTRQLIFNYKGYLGRAGLKFQYLHASDENNRIDPSSSNIMDTYLLTKQYDTSYRQYLAGAFAAEPLPMSSDQLFRTYGGEINKIKSISDEIVYHPVKFKVLFGSKANPSLQATLKVVKNTDRVVNDQDVKSKIIEAIEEFFALENWNFGETFYWSELSAYIMQSLAPDLHSIVLVPNSATDSFGSLFEVKSENDEIFISGATVDNVEIITAITAERLKASGAIVTSVNDTSQAVSSSSETVVTTTSSSSNSGGSSY